MDEKLVARVLSFRWLVFAVLAMGFALVYFHRVSLSVVADELRRDFQTSAEHDRPARLDVLLLLRVHADPRGPAERFRRAPQDRGDFAAGGRGGRSSSSAGRRASGSPIVARAMVGIGVSMVFIPSMKVFSQWFRAREFAHVGGMFQSAGGIGILAGTWLLSLPVRAIRLAGLVPDHRRRPRSESPWRPG